MALWRPTPEEERVREEPAFREWLQRTSDELASLLYEEGFVSYLVSIYPNYPLHGSPAIVNRYLEEFFRPRYPSINRQSRWLQHVSISMAGGLSRASYECTDGSYWQTEPFRPQA